MFIENCLIKNLTLAHQNSVFKRILNAHLHKTNMKKTLDSLKVAIHYNNNLDFFANLGFIDGKIP